MSADLAAQPARDTRANCPLCVDAEGALIRTNPLAEAWLSLLRARPVSALLALGHLMRGGRRGFTVYVEARVQFKAAQLPYDALVLEHAHRARSQGRTIALLSTLPAPWARQIAAYLGCFDTVLAGEAGRNHRAEGRDPVLAAHYGAQTFEYVGRADSPVWSHAQGGIVVASDRSGAAAARRAPTAEVLVRGRADWRAWLRQIRLHQWVKNLLIFVPLVASRRIGDPQMARAAVAGFLAFGCIASASYILNDLLDLPHDRLHPTKRLRPLAAGVLPIRTAAAAMIALLAVGVSLAATLPVTFAAVLALYLCGTLAYSFFLRRLAPLDAFTLAGLYTLRVFGGNAATGLPSSFWLLAFSIFLFLSLAMAKRHAELARSGAAGESAAHGRGYQAGDREMVSQLGVGSGYISVLVLALYLNSPKAAELYRRPDLLWLLCVLLLYWITRLWLVAHRGELDDDPVVFALRDRCSRLVALAVVVVLLLA